MADIDLYINAAPISLTLSAAQGPAGEAGSSTLSGLTDITTYDLPANNTPLSDALATKAPISGASMSTPTLENASLIGATEFNSTSITYNPGSVADTHRTALGLGTEQSPVFAGVTASGTVEASSYTLNGVAQQDVSTGANVAFAGGVLGSNKFVAASLTIDSSNNIRINLGRSLYFGTGRIREVSSRMELLPDSGGVYVGGNLTASGTVTGASFIEGAQTPITLAGTATLSLSTGSVIQATLQSEIPCEITLPDVVSGASFILHLRQPASGTPTTATFAASPVVVWVGGTAPTITATLGKQDIISFVANQAGTKWFGSYVQNFTY